MGDSAAEYSKTGCALVATAVSRVRALPAAHTLVEDRYKKVAKLLQDTVRETIRRLAPDVDSADTLELANDVLLQRLEDAFRQLEGKPKPMEVVCFDSPKKGKRTIPRPQLLFSEPVDNDRSTIWKSKITTKPNAIVSLELNPELDPSGNVIGYSHPYEIEIRQYQPSDELLSADLEPQIRLKSKTTTPFTFVDTEEGLQKLVSKLHTVKEIAIDVEHHSYRTFLGITCLLQLSTEDHGDFVIDTLKLRDSLHVLNESFTDPKVLKVFHGAEYDVIWLQRDLGVYIVGLFDTHRAAIELNLPNKSLQFLMAKYCKENVDKRFQLADWRERPLSEEMLDYARSDTHSLLYIWRAMRAELLAAAGGAWDQLVAAFEASRKVSLRTYRKPKFNDTAHVEFAAKCRRKFDSRQMCALKLLFEWRDRIAREEDESIGYVLPNHMLLEIAVTLPKETSGILVCCSPAPPLLLHNLNAVHRIVMEARNVPLEEIPDTVQDIQPESDSFSLTSFHHQSLIGSFRSISLSRTDPPSEERNKFKQKEADNTNHITEITKFFLSPFDRYKLMQRYNQTVAVTIPEAPIKPEPVVAKRPASVMTPDTPKVPLKKPDVDGKLKSTPNSTTSKKAKRQTNGEPEHIHKYKKPKNNISTEDSAFEPFDYNSFDYKKFNRNPNGEKKRFKRKK